MIYTEFVQIPSVYLRRLNKAYFLVNCPKRNSHTRQGHRWGGGGGVTAPTPNKTILTIRKPSKFGRWAWGKSTKSWKIYQKILVIPITFITIILDPFSFKFWRIFKSPSLGKDRARAFMTEETLVLNSL